MIGCHVCKYLLRVGLGVDEFVCRLTDPHFQLNGTPAPVVRTDENNLSDLYRPTSM